MATLKQRLHRKNSSGSYDTVHLETSSSMVLRPNGNTVEDDLANYLPEVQDSDNVPESLKSGRIITGNTKAWVDTRTAGIKELSQLGHTHQSTDITGLSNGGISPVKYESVNINTTDSETRDISEYSFIIAGVGLIQSGGASFRNFCWIAVKIDDVWKRTEDPFVYLNSNSISLKFSISDNTLTLTPSSNLSLFTITSRFIYFK